VPADRLDHRLGFAGEPRPGHPGGLDPGEQQLVIPFPVFLERQSRPVRPEDVEFDPEAVIGPVRVDLVAGDETVEGAGSQPSRTTSRNRRSRSERVKTGVSS
jgi:hypothetical protein